MPLGFPPFWKINKSGVFAMGFRPEYALNMIEDAVFAERMDSIRAQLEECRVSGFFPGVAGVKIFFEYLL